MKTDATAKLPVFARRFRELRGERSQAKFSEDLGISRPTIGFYENGDRVPDALTLKIISEKCNVPSDWLIGLTENQMSDNIEIGRTTGLTDAAIEKLRFYAYDEQQLTIHLVNRFIEESIPMYLAMDLEQYSRALNARSNYVSESDEILDHLMSAEVDEGGRISLPPLETARYLLQGMQNQLADFIKKFANDMEASNGEHPKD
ncbi:MULTISPECIES: helix-turn-helix domain-containing protein [Anaerotruncus]|uniref:helix-turn-helix domain-containing protein n=1 Tax=Anaerotruncus TaxID=244127 RepID=UPI000E4E06BF|nr:MULTISPECIES: helix-turn-helix transcriptional regulator [Anaerotruncus]RGX55703.1 XRE family transcriptional regulator [Anaerotruncus sp. AF02-27]